MVEHGAETSSSSVRSSSVEIFADIIVLCSADEKSNSAGAFEGKIKYIHTLGIIKRVITRISRFDIPPKTYTKEK